MRSKEPFLKWLMDNPEGYKVSLFAIWLTFTLIFGFLSLFINNIFWRIVFICLFCWISWQSYKRSQVTEDFTLNKMMIQK